MNTTFYLALDRLPMSLVAAMEFVGTIGVALYGLRTGRNVIALLLAVVGVFILVDVKWATDPLGLFWSTLNAVLFVGYIVLGHKAAEGGASGGVERLGAGMAIAFIFVMPIGILEAIRAFGAIELVLAGIGVGICSSVILVPPLLNSSEKPGCRPFEKLGWPRHCGYDASQSAKLGQRKRVDHIPTANHNKFFFSS